MLVNYSSSSGSEDEETTKQFQQREVIQILPRNQKNKILLPQAISLLGKRKQKEDDNFKDDPAQHEGRVRSFKHERGNWATYVYIPIKNNTLEDVQDICHLHLEDKINSIISTETHISLTKTVILRYHFIESFVETLRTTIETLNSFTVFLDNLKVYTNAEHTRTFLALSINDLYIEKISNILHRMDSIMKDFKLSTFYENPSFHISILWCTGDYVSLMETSLPTIMESLKDRLPLCLKIDQIYCKCGFKEFYFKLK